jgi:hypothetical protein
VAVKNEAQVKNEIVRLRLAGIAENTFQFIIAPTLFNKHQLSNSIRAGKRPAERIYQEKT